MSYHYNSHIVQDGLVLCFDAGDKNSHSGTTTFKDLSGNSNNGTLSSSAMGYSDSGYNIQYGINNASEDAMIISSGDSSTLTNGQIFLIDSEKVKVGAFTNMFGSYPRFSITRGYDSTTATSHSAGTDLLEAGSEINFDGNDDYVQIGDSSTMALGNGSVTFMAWVKFNSVSGNQVIIGDEGGQGDTTQNNFHNFMLFDEGNVGQIALRGHTLSPNQYNFILSSTNNVVSANNWYHLVAVLDRHNSSNSKIYVNGDDKTGSATNFDNGLNSMDFSYWSLGRRTNVGDFDLNAKISSVVQYNRPLSSTEVLQNFNAHRGRFNV